MISLTREVAINVLFAFFLLGYEDHTKASGTCVTSELHFLPVSAALLQDAVKFSHSRSHKHMCLLPLKFHGRWGPFKIPTGRTFLL